MLSKTHTGAIRHRARKKLLRRGSYQFPVKNIIQNKIVHHVLKW
jgi:hypothetical protein